MLATAVHGRTSDICIVWTCSKLLVQTYRPFLGCRSFQFQTFHLSAGKTENYNGDSTSLSALLRANSTLPTVFQVSDVPFVVPGVPSTNNTLGYYHIKVEDGALA